jgi:hypothetical protein
MATKIYSKGNYIIVDDGVNPKNEMFNKDCKIVPYTQDSISYYRVLDEKSTVKDVLASEIVDENGDAYLDFDTWRAENTGFNTGAGGSVPYFVQCTSSSPASGGTNYFGGYPKGLVTSANISKVYIQKDGVIKSASINCYSGTAGTDQNWSMYIRVNNSEDHLIETIGTATNERTFNNESLNVPVVKGDYFEIKTTNPTWGTPPLTTAMSGNVIVD